ncbi:alpha/beta fold hydrolase [Prochlorococcus marinus]|uniref:alpha/beta fold hydrolase n=1 Tax=Prochlorococcus marinus TaxID=1219 RepID=UPI0007BB7714|nr:alpha/beta fold hydrolase [Prochlorococcus marinus]KZR78154.1 2-hydroxy-6-oxo-6-(2'-aminophenyl)hexa-2,4-dienoic acid hydrolase [Prochlorococcus marinus str. MIT 1320]
MQVSWNCIRRDPASDPSAPAVVLIHGFGANKDHWRHNQPALAEVSTCYAIDLIGFGASSQPRAQLTGEAHHRNHFSYSFDSWASQVADFCREVVKAPVVLVGNSIGGVIALRTAQLISQRCSGVVLINCAQRTMDDKRLHEQPVVMRWLRPSLKALVRQHWLSRSLFRNAANPRVIKQVLKQAYPSGSNVDESLMNLLQKPAQRPNAAEAFRGFINLFDDHLAPTLMTNLKVPVDLIWGEDDPWEPLQEAQRWASRLACIRSLEIIAGAGHCPHDESPEQVNPLLLRAVEKAKNI